MNTGIFCAGLVTFFSDTFNEWMMGWVSSTGNEANPLLYIILVLVGVNFLIELGINLVLSPDHRAHHPPAEEGSSLT